MAPPAPGWFGHVASFSVGAAAAAAAGLLLRSPRGEVRTDGAIGTSHDDEAAFYYGAAVAHHPARHLLPTPPLRVFRPNDHLLVAFDARTKNPAFVVERLAGRRSRSGGSESDRGSESPGAAAASRKHKRFREEAALPPHHRSRNGQYRRSGYDRGHLAPAADFPRSDEEMDDTFVLTNVSPQRPRFNRSAWLRLEEFVRSEAQKERGGKGPSSETWVITGPLWLPSAIDTGGDKFRYSYEGIGTPPSLVAVPTHFYKVVAVVENNAPTAGAGEASSRRESEAVLTKFGAFVLPNSDAFGDDGIRLVDHLARLEDLEAVTGLEFFPALFGAYVRKDFDPDADDVPVRKRIADALTDDVRFRAGGTENGKQKRSDVTALVPSARGGEWSKSRRKKVQQILRANEPIPFQHLCRENDACYKLLKV
ncbi:hypothetical protein ACHAWF_009421 [Thalassiosira exigua]